ncbi:MAG: DUF4868 domain-containing protein [Clostridiales bacterium]|nr:DUF4868 domain-containing protein [Clostridiales bacterium]
MSFSPNVSDEILSNLIEGAKEYIEKFIDLEVVEYNPTGYRDSTLEFTTCDYVGNYNEIIGSFDEGNIENLQDEVNKFNFYCIEICTEDHNIKLIRRVTKFKKLYSKGIIAAFNGNLLNKIDDKILGMDGEIDILVLNDENIVVFNHIALERIFKLNDQFEIKASQALEVIKSTNTIRNYDMFEDDCLNDKRYQKILTKMLREEGLNNCFDNFDNIIETVELFDLDIEVKSVPEKMIVYRDKSQIMDILRLARDSYYRSTVREKPGIDNKI